WGGRGLGSWLQAREDAGEGVGDVGGYQADAARGGRALAGDAVEVHGGAGALEDVAAGGGEEGAERPGQDVASAAAGDAGVPAGPDGLAAVGGRYDGRGALARAHRFRVLRQGAGGGEGVAPDVVLAAEGR